MFVPCTALLYDSRAATRTLKLSTTLLSIYCGIHLISVLMMFYLVCGLFSQTLFFRYPLKNSQTGCDIGNRMARGYWFDLKWVCSMGSYARGIQVFCLRNEAPSHFSNRTLEYSRHKFPWGKLILSQTNNPWPSYSQCHNLPDYFLRGYLKDRVCENNPQARENIIRTEIRWIPQ